MRRQALQQLLDKHYRNDGSAIFYRTEGASTAGIITSLTDAIARRGATGIEVLCHSDCAAIRVLSKVLSDSKYHNDIIDGGLVSQFNMDNDVNGIRMKLLTRDVRVALESSDAFSQMRRVIEGKNPSVQRTHLNVMFSDFVGLKISAKRVELENTRLSPGSSPTIVLTNATTASASQICKEAGTDPTATYIIATAYPSEALNPLRLLTKSIDAMISARKMPEVRKIRIVSSQVPTARVVEENVDKRRVPANPFRDWNWSSEMHYLLSAKRPALMHSWDVSRFSGGKKDTQGVEGGKNIYLAAALPPRAKRLMTGA